MTVVGEAFIEIKPATAGFEKVVVADATEAAKKAGAALDSIAVGVEGDPFADLTAAARAAAGQAADALDAIPADVDPGTFTQQVVEAARQAAQQAAAQLDNIPADFDPARFVAEVGAAAARAAGDASERLGGVPMGVNVAGLSAEVASAAERAAMQAAERLDAIPVDSAPDAFSDVARQAERAASRAADALDDVPVRVDDTQLSGEVVAAARRAAQKAARELSNIPGGVDAATFEAKVSEAARRAAAEAAQRLRNIPADVDVAGLTNRVANEAARAAALAGDRLDDIPVDADTTNLVRSVDRGMDQAERRVDAGAKRMAADTRGAMDGLGRTLARGLAVVGGAQLITGSVAAAREANKAQAQTEAAIRSTGGAARVTAKDMDALTAAVQENTKVDGDNVRQGANLLLTFTNIKNEVGSTKGVFSEATELLVDMGAALGTDVAGSAVQLGKALNDPIAGISALSRVGVTFTAQQKDQIRVMVEAGNVADAQRVILAELRKEFGGSAAAQADALDELALEWDAFQESVGGAVLRAVGFINAIPGPIKVAGLALGGLAGGAVVVSKVADAVGNLTSKATELAATNPGLGRVGTTLGRIGAAGAVLGSGVLAVDAATKAYQRLEFGAAPVLSEFTRDLLVFADTGRSSGELARQLGSDFSGLADDLEALTRKKSDDPLGFVDVLGTAIFDRGRMNEARENIGALDDALASLVAQGQAPLAETVLARVLKEAGVGLATINPMLDNYRGALADADVQQRLTTHSAGDLADGSDAITEGFTDSRTATERLATALDTFKTALDTALGAQIDSERASLSFIDTVQRLRDTVNEGGKSLDINTEAGRRNRSAILDVVDGARQHIQAMADEGATADQLRATWVTHRGELAAVLTQLGLNKGEASGYLSLLDQVPDNVFTALKLETEAARKQYDDLVGDLKAETEPIIIPVKLVNYGNIQAREHGGMAYPGQVYRVGERQPETYQPTAGGPPQVVGAGGPQLFSPPAPGYVHPVVTKAASGALVHATPGGSILNVAEGGRDEAVVPLPPGLLLALERIASGAGLAPVVAGNLVVQGATVGDAYATGMETVHQLRSLARPSGK